MDKGAASTSARPRLKIFLKAGRSWHVEFSYTDILLRLNCFILYICFVTKVTIEGKILPNVFPPHSYFLFHQSQHIPATVCIHTSCTLFSCFKPSLFLLRNELFWAKTYGSQCKTDRQKGSFACVQRDPACLWVLWSPTLLRLGGVSQNQQLAQLLHAPCWRTASYEVLLHKSLWWCWWLGADQMLWDGGLR